MVTLILVAPVLANLPGDTRIHRGDALRRADRTFEDRAWETVEAAVAFLSKYFVVPPAKLYRTSEVASLSEF